MTRPRPINFAPPAKAQGNRLAAFRRESAPTWYRIENTAAGADVYLYDVIGDWGVTAGDFVDAIKGLGTAPIALHVNSPGGDVWDGVAIYNAIRNHPGQVTVHVEGIAASAASFIAMAGDQVLMAKGSTMMIHDALMLTIGNAADHTDGAQLLEKISATIAEIYADRAGGEAGDWRAAMQAGTDGTWYTAAEAVAAGLADEIAEPQAKAVAAVAVMPLNVTPEFPVAPSTVAPAAPPAPTNWFDAEAIRTALREAVA